VEKTKETSRSRRPGRRIMGSGERCLRTRPKVVMMCNSSIFFNWNRASHGLLLSSSNGSQDISSLSFVNCDHGNSHVANLGWDRSSSVRCGAIWNALWCSRARVWGMVILRDSRLDMYSLHLRSPSKTSFAPPPSFKSAFFHRFKHDNSIPQTFLGNLWTPERGMDTSMVRGCCPDRSRYKAARRFISVK